MFKIFEFNFSSLLLLVLMCFGKALQNMFPSKVENSIQVNVITENSQLINFYAI